MQIENQRKRRNLSKLKSHERQHTVALVLQTSKTSALIPTFPAKRPSSFEHVTRLDTTNMTTITESKVELQADEVNAALIQSLSASITLRTLHIAPSALDESSRVALLELVPSVKSLEGLSLSLGSFDDVGMAQLAQRLLINYSIETVNGIDLFSFREESAVYSVDLSDTKLEPSDARLIAELVKLNATVIEIKLAKSFVPIKQIRSGIKQGKLVLSRNLLTILDFHFLKSIVPSKSELDTVHVANCAMNDECAEVFAEMMKEASVQTIDMSHNCLSHRGCLAILRSAAIAGVEELDLRGSSLLSTMSELQDTLTAFTAAKKLTEMNGFKLKNIQEATKNLKFHLEGIDSGFASLLLSASSSLPAVKSLSISRCKLEENLDVFTNILCNSLGNCEELETLCLADNKLPDDFAFALANQLSLMRIKRLDLRGNKFGKGAVELAKALKRSRCLQSVNLQDNDVNESRTKRIMKSLVQVDSLQELNGIQLNQNEEQGEIVELTGFDYLSIAASLCSKSNTKKLSVVRSQVNCAKAAFIGGLICNSSLEVLDLSYNEVGDNGARAIADGIVTRKGLKHLNLSHNLLQDSAIAELAQCLHASSLHTLNISGNQFGCGGACGLARAIGEGISLNTLDLSDNSVGDDGLASVCRALPNAQLETLRLRAIGISALKCLGSVLKQESHIQVLDLSRNGIGSSCAHIAEALKSNTSLTHLILQENRIGDTISSLLAHALSKNKTLRKLNLRHNRIKDKGAQDIAKALFQNSNLQSLDLASNFIGEEGGLSLSRAFAKTCGLKCVDIRCNKFSAPVIEKISLAWEANKNLQTLRLFNFSSQNGSKSVNETDSQYSESATIVRPGSEPSFASTALSQGGSESTQQDGASTTGISTASMGGGRSWNRLIRVPTRKMKAQRTSSASSHQVGAEASKKRSSLRNLVNLTQGRKQNNSLCNSSKDSTLWRRRKLKEEAKFDL